MFNVYWMEDGKPHAKLFSNEEMTDALKWMEKLRELVRVHDANISFICMSSENPNNLTKMGVDVTGPDYEWKKRRI